MIVAACSSTGSETNGDDAEVATTLTEATSDPESGDAAPATTAAAVPHIDLTELEAQSPDVIDADAALRCDRLGYACSISDLDDRELERAIALSTELTNIIDEADGPVSGLDSAALRLSEEPDLVELIIDREGYTGLMFRLAGTPEIYATTELAEPLGEPETLDLTALGAKLDELVASAPAGFAGTGLRRAPNAYHPTGGPRNPRAGVVLDPYATESAACPDGINQESCAVSSDGRVEGSVVAAVMSAHPDITAKHLTGSQVTHWNLPDLSGFDLVHVVSHGSSGCGGNVGWTGGVSTADAPDLTPDEIRAEWRNNYRDTPFDPNACYSAFALGSFSVAEYEAAGRPAGEPGIGLGGCTNNVCNTFATTEYFVGKFGPEAIVYFSHCTSADGQLAHSGQYGSFVGWHSYARTSVAAEAGIRFWELMVTEGVEFDLAIEWMESHDLGWSFSVQIEAPTEDHFSLPDEVAVGASAAFLAHRGKNQRARDVITLKIDSGDPDGQVLRVEGMPGDGIAERFPAQDQQVTFDLEGVKHGTDDSVLVEMYLDGEKLAQRSPLKLSDHGTETERDDWSKWSVSVPQGHFELPDTAAADYDVSSAMNDLEIRAFTDASEYTADGGLVSLGTRLAANGPIPIFTELAAGMPAGGELLGNDLRIEFDTAGGEVTGAMRVEMNAQGFSVGFWDFALTGNYDATNNQMTGELNVAAGETIAVINVPINFGSGGWQGSVDLSAQTLNATLGDAEGSQQYQGQLSPVTG